MIIEKRNRVLLNLNVWMTLFARYLPSFCRATSTNRILKLADRSLAEIERKLDVKNVIQNSEDM
jgi:hypothetical protein